jgi:hypothetical protein
LGSALGTDLVDQTISAGVASYRDGTCGGSGPELGYLWTAPSTSVYTFDTAGSDYDTTVYILDGSCSGAELTCGSHPTQDGAQAMVSLTQDQQIIVFVDSKDGAVGTFKLSIAETPLTSEIGWCSDNQDNDGDGATDCADPDCIGATNCMGACPGVDLGSVLGANVANASSAGWPDNFSACSGSGPEVTFTWTAPTNGTYVFDTNGSTYDTVLHLWDSCTGSSLICDDDSGLNSAAAISHTMSQGESVLVVLDSYGSSGGNFTLNIQRSLTVSEVNLCDDNTDNDGDGFTDCADSDCVGNASCP